MLDNFLVGLVSGFLVLVVLAFTAILGYALGGLVEVNQQMTSAGFVIAVLILGVVSVIHRRLK